MEFICYTDWQQLPESADALFAQHEHDSMFLSRTWFVELAASALEHGDSLLLACVVDGDQVLAMLPLRRCAGDTWYSLSNRYTSHFSLLINDNEEAGDDRQAILECLVQGLGSLPYRVLRLEPVAEHDPVITDMQTVMESAGMCCHRFFKFYNWIHRLQGESFSDYFSARPPILRNSIKRKQRKLEREHGYRIRLFTRDDLEPAMRDYDSIYRASWKPEEPFGAFIEVLVRRLAERGWTRLAILYAGDEPVAGQIWFVVHENAYIFRLAYDQAWQKSSPGSILTSYLMEHVIDTDGVEQIDYLIGNERYKQDWMSERRQYFGLVCDNISRPVSRFERLVKNLRQRVFK